MRMSINIIIKCGIYYYFFSFKVYVKFKLMLYILVNKNGILF